MGYTIDDLYKLDLTNNSHFIFILCECGTFSVYQNQKFVTITPNMGIILLPQASYKIISSSPDCRVEIIYKNINDEYHKQLLAPIIDILNNLKAFKNNCYHLTEECHRVITHLAGEIRKSNERLKHTNDGNKIKLEKYYQSMCIHSVGLNIVLENGFNIEGNTSSIEADYVSDFVILVQKNCKTERKVDFYAQKLGISVSKLSKATCSLMDKTPSKLIADETISQIIGDALNPQHNNKAIAEKFGFTDVSGLYRYIKTHTEYKNLSQLTAAFKVQR
ncbi:MAG: hypothetical protein MJ197_03425 [Bacteroidales bacterium]|nr:hypothetical protein [Bacteroidales bacterium]